MFRRGGSSAWVSIWRVASYTLIAPLTIAGVQNNHYLPVLATLKLNQTSLGNGFGVWFITFKRSAGFGIFKVWLEFAAKMLPVPILAIL